MKPELLLNTPNYTINLQYWYGDDDNFRVLLALLQKNQLKLATDNKGIVLNLDDSLYTHNGLSFSLGIDFSLQMHLLTTISKLEFLRQEIEKVRLWNKTQFQNDAVHVIKQHKFLMPLNLYNFHWSTMEIMLNIDCTEDTFLITKNIIVTIYDSSNICKTSDIVRLKDILNDFFNDIEGVDDDFECDMFLQRTKKQPDLSSCGPISCGNIINLVLGNQVENAPEEFYEADVKVIREEQAAAVNDPEFLSKQHNEMVFKMGAMRLNQDVPTLVSAIMNYVNDPSNWIFKAIEELVVADVEMQEATHANRIISNPEFEVLNNNYIQKLTAIKQWFLWNYLALLELNVLTHFFRVAEDNRPGIELEWADNGKDTLIAVCKQILSTLKPTDYLEQVTHAAVEQNTYSSNYYVSQAVIYYGKKRLYVHDSKSTDVKDNCLVRESIQNAYAYTGTMCYGVKIGVCEENFYHADFKIHTWFKGERNLESGAFKKGIISCFVGDMMSNGFFLLYTGNIQEEKLNGLATLQMVSLTQKNSAPVQTFFCSNLLIGRRASTSPKTLKGILKFLQFSTSDNLWLENNIKMIKDHIEANTGNLLLMSSQDEFKLASIRHQTTPTVEPQVPTRQNSEFLFMSGVMSSGTSKGTFSDATVRSKTRYLCC